MPDAELLRDLLREQVAADREQAGAIAKLAAEVGAMRGAIEANTAAATGCASSREHDAKTREAHDAAQAARESRWHSRLDAVLSSRPVQWLSVMLLACMVVYVATGLGVWDAVEPFVAHAIGRCP